jgi:hypothetical protein
MGDCELHWSGWREEQWWGTWQWTCGSHNMWEIYWLAKELLDSQIGIPVYGIRYHIFCIRWLIVWGMQFSIHCSFCKLYRSYHIHLTPVSWVWRCLFWDNKRISRMADFHHAFKWRHKVSAFSSHVVSRIPNTLQARQHKSQNTAVILNARFYGRYSRNY